MLCHETKDVEAVIDKAVSAKAVVEGKITESPSYVYFTSNLVDDSMIASLISIM
ncbi:hypothetical protein CRYUN_Cryun40dG0061800 [Craigia yunnanensis]